MAPGSVDGIGIRWHGVRGASRHRQLFRGRDRALMGRAEPRRGQCAERAKDGIERLQVLSLAKRLAPALASSGGAADRPAYLDQSSDRNADELVHSCTELGGRMGPGRAMVHGVLSSSTAETSGAELRGGCADEAWSRRCSARTRPVMRHEAPRLPLRRKWQASCGPAVGICPRPPPSGPPLCLTDHHALSPHREQGRCKFPGSG